MVSATLTEPYIREGVYSSDKEFLPLRILNKNGTHYLSCPYELHEDSATLRIVVEDTRIAHLQLTAIPDPFKRHMLFSFAPSSTIVSASGYLFDGPVKVSAWKVDKGAEIDPLETEDIGLLANVDMIHVRGDDENKTAGFDNALDTHRRRLRGLNTRSMTIDSAVAFYKVLQHHVPRY